MNNQFVSMMCACLLVAQAVHGAQPCGAGFSPAVSLTGFNFASAVEQADFNRDGKRDLVVANTGAGTISVLLGDGAGGYTVHGTYTSGTYPGSMEVGDFNRDGYDDVAVPNEANANVRVFLGNGTGTLTSLGVTPAGTTPRAVRTADFNQDGRLDLAVVNTNSATVTVNFGVGDGTFTAPVSFAVPAGPWSLTVADVNLDGVPDVLVPSLGGGTNVVSILFGVPGGNFSTVFQSAVSIPTGTSPSGVAVGDLNRDGWPDLVVSNTGGANVSVHRATAPGLFQAGKVDYPAGNGPAAVRLADFNGDGLLDAVVSNDGGGGGGVNVLYGNGNATFQTRVSFAAGIGSRNLTVGDFNADGRPDLAVANVQSNDVSILLGFNGTTPYSGFPVTGPTYSTGGANPAGIAVGDLNQDGRPDLVTANVLGNNLGILLGQSGGAFQSPVTYPVPNRPVKVLLADLNRDGKLDIAAASLSGAVAILSSTGAATYSTNTYPTPAGTRDLVALDVNRDGSLDLVAINEETNSYSIFINDGFGAFTVSSFGLAGRPQSMAAGDFNRDGVMDVAIGNSGSPDLVILRGNGAGGFLQSSQSFSTTVYRSLVAGDFNLDGKLDLLGASSQGTNMAYANIFLGNGDGTFQSPLLSAVPEMPMEIAMADFNADGKPDFVVNSNPTSMVTRRGDGTGGFTNDGGYAPGGDPWGIAIADFNGDGRLDLALARSSAGNVMILLNMAPFRPEVLLSASNVAPLFGEPVTFTATVAAAYPNCEIPSGQVYFQAGATALGTFALNAAGVASVTTSTLPLGPVSVVAAYRGNAQFHPRESAPLSVTVSKLPAVLTLSGLNHVYDGTPKQATVTTAPAGLTGVSVTYNGLATLPVNPGSYAVVATLTHAIYDAAPAVATLVVVNPDQTGPAIANVTLTPNPASLGTPVALSALVSDTATGNSAIASAGYSVDNGQSWSPMTGAFGSAAEIPVAATLNLPVGVHAVCVRATDALQNSTIECGALLAVYDPDGGFVTGGGWIESPAGAFPADPAKSGKANFGFSSKYEQGATVPSGDTQFRFQAAGMQFKSTSYQWLIVAGARAQFKGVGTLNGSDGFGFLLTAIDGQLNGGGGKDRFRIKIWSLTTGDTVYDNQMGKSENGSDATELGGGSIVIHKP